MITNEGGSDDVNDVVELTPEQIQERLTNPEGSFKAGDKPIVAKDAIKAELDEQGNPKPEKVVKPVVKAGDVDFGTIGKSYFEKVGLTTDFKVEEGQDPVEVINSKLTEKLIKTLPPLAQFVLKHEQVAGFNEEEFLSQLVSSRSNTLKGEPLMQEYLYKTYGKYDEKTNPDGLTEQDVKDHLSKMGKIERLNFEKEAAKHFEGNKSAKMEEYLTERQAKNTKAFEDSVAAMQSIADKGIEISAKIKDIQGVEVSQTELAEFNKVYPDLVKPRKESGLAPILEILYEMDPDELYKFTFMLTKKEGYFKDQISEKINEVKTGLKKKLKLTPRESKGASEEGLKEIDPFLLTQPERK